MRLMSGSPLAWSSLGSPSAKKLPMRWPQPVTRDWAWGGSTGRGVRGCIVGSGIEFAAGRGAFAARPYFRGSLRVCSAHTRGGESSRGRFAPVVSGGSHARDDELAFDYTARPPVEFFGRGIDVEVAWTGGGSTV